MFAHEIEQDLPDELGIDEQARIAIAVVFQAQLHLRFVGLPMRRRALACGVASSVGSAEPIPAFET